MHKKMMKKDAKEFAKDANKYKKEAKHSKGIKKKHALTEAHEAESVAKDLKKRAKKAHEY